jgi:serine/threonine protein phosphatase PrpC
MTPNIYWPENPHWQTKALIEQCPIMNSDDLWDIIEQRAILEAIKQIQDQVRKDSVLYSKEFKKDIENGLKQIQKIIDDSNNIESE